MRRWGEGATGGNVGGCVLNGEPDSVSEVSLWGEQLGWGPATLPTLSSLSRINDGVRPISIHVHVSRLYTRTHLHHLAALTMSDLHRHAQPPPCHIYPQQCEGEGRLLLVSNKRVTSEWEEAKHSPVLPPQRLSALPSPSPTCLTSNEVDKC